LIKKKHQQALTIKEHGPTNPKKPQITEQENKSAKSRY
jgi:hypothetical protein